MVSGVVLHFTIHQIPALKKKQWICFCNTGSLAYQHLPICVSVKLCTLPNTGLSQLLGRYIRSIKSCKGFASSALSISLSPPPLKLIQEFLRDGIIISTVELARSVPMADAITVEGDSEVTQILDHCL